jgi:hypothetical protein
MYEKHNQKVIFSTFLEDIEMHNCQLLPSILKQGDTETTVVLFRLKTPVSISLVAET